MLVAWCGAGGAVALGRMDAGLGVCIITPAAGILGNHKGCPYVWAWWGFGAGWRLDISRWYRGQPQGLPLRLGIEGNHEGCPYV